MILRMLHLVKSIVEYLMAGGGVGDDTGTASSSSVNSQIYPHFQEFLIDDKIMNLLLLPLVVINKVRR